MTAAQGDVGFSGGLGVVRVQISPENYVASFPMPATTAGKYAANLAQEIEDVGDTAKLIQFDADSGLDCWIRAREVLTVDVVSTEDPSA